MRDVLHAAAAAAVIAVAALCTLVQLSDANRAFDRLGHDEQVLIQQVGSSTVGGTGGSTGGGPGRGHGHRR
ncbi:MAG TPA: hypothetical protein VFT70_00745 [Nocardioides sp.]|nr:hypothetical protein [Nocardioides sp.]